MDKILSTAELTELNAAKENLYNKYRAISSTVPSKRDMGNWKEEKFVDYFNFASLFIHRNPDGTTKILTSIKKVREVELFLMQKDHPYHEFIFRMGQFTSSQDFSTKKYYFKFMAMLRQVGQYLRNNPATVGDKLRAVLEPEERFNWCLKNIKIVTTDIGAEVIAYENTDDAQLVIGNKAHNVVTHEKRYAEALIQATDVFYNLSKSISKSDIAKMTPKDKIAALSKMAGVMSLHKSFKPGKSVFNQIVIHNADREQLEEAFLDFGKK